MRATVACQGRYIMQTGCAPPNTVDAVLAVQGVPDIRGASALLVFVIGGKGVAHHLHAWAQSVMNSIQTSQGSLSPVGFRVHETHVSLINLYKNIQRARQCHRDAHRVTPARGWPHRQRAS